MYFFDCIYEVAFCVFDITVSCSDTGNVGTMFFLCIVVMCYIQVHINIVECIRNLCGQIDIIGCDCTLCFIIDVCFFEQFIYVCLVDQINFFVQCADCIIKRFRIKGSVVCIQTGIDDCNSLTGTGIVGPYLCCVGHVRGYAHVRIISLFSRFNSFVLVFYEDIFDTFHRLDSFDGCDRYISGNNICG